MNTIGKNSLAPAGRKMKIATVVLATLATGVAAGQTPGYIPIWSDNMGTLGDSRLFQCDGADVCLGQGSVPFIHNFGGSFGFNTFIGRDAGNLAMTGDRNTATGSRTLSSNTTGFGNTATGVDALTHNTEGGNSTATGVLALNSNTSGGGNTASGAYALSSNTTGNDNTAVGIQALERNTTATHNTAIGDEALSFNTIGERNTATGALALQNNTTDSNNTAIGYSALRLNIGTGNTAIGSRALFGNSTGGVNTALGFFADVSASDLNNATAIGYAAVVNASNKVRIGNEFVTVIEGQVGFTSSSDATKKENFQPVDGDDVLNKIRGLTLRTWNFIGQDPKQFRHYGPTAQDFFAAFGHDVIGTIGSPITITSTDMEGVLMVASQALERRTADQGKEIDALRAENADLRTRLEALERVSASVLRTRLESSNSRP